jgi:hypothetical protein
VRDRRAFTLCDQSRLLSLTRCRSFEVIGSRYALSIDMNHEICFALAQRIYRIRYPSGNRLNLTLGNVLNRTVPELSSVLLAMWRPTSIEVSAD